MISGRKGLTAHRTAYRLWVGEPGDQHVLHTCDNPPCCNPKHLYLGGSIENARDRVERNRTAKGSVNARAKLTEEQVAEIKAALRRGEKQEALASRWGVARMTITRISNGSNWSHV